MQSVAFFDRLKQQVQKGDEEEKEEAMEMMAQLYERMTQESKKISERAGLSEDELLAYAENPANFTAEQWRALQESKVNISRAGRELAKAVYEKGKEGILPPPEKKKKPTSLKKIKKSGWMRS